MSEVELIGRETTATSTASSATAVDTTAQKSILAREVVRLRAIRSDLLSQLAADGDDDSELQYEHDRLSRLFSQRRQETEDKERRLKMDISQLRSRLNAQSGNETSTASAAVNLSHIRKFDARFEKKAAEIRRALATSSLDHVAGIDTSASDMRNFLQQSTQRINSLSERASSLRCERPLHVLVSDLLKENGQLRCTVNNYTEGLVEQTLRRWENAVATDGKAGAFRMCF